MFTYLFTLYRILVFGAVNIFIALLLLVCLLYCKKILPFVEQCWEGRRRVRAMFSLVICEDEWCLPCCPASIKLPLTLLGFRQAEVSYEAWPIQFTMRLSNNFTSLSHCVCLSSIPFYPLTFLPSQVVFHHFICFHPILFTPV